MGDLKFRGNIYSKNNLALCQYDYFEACWCQLNSSKIVTCPYLLRHVPSYSNSSYFCVYHIIRKTIECFNSTNIYPIPSVSNIYVYLTIFLFIIGLIGNGISIIILLSTKLHRLSVYRNITILCFLNILYLLLTLVRYRNIYNQDLRQTTSKLCRLHMFTVAFIGHACSWQLVSTSIQRVYGLLSLKTHQSTSWIQTGRIFMFYIFLPLLIFDSQLLFNYGVFSNSRICTQTFDNATEKFRLALKYPFSNTEILNQTPINYFSKMIKHQSINENKSTLCVIWNTIDTLLYAIIPFIIVLICSFIIIIKVCQRRRSTITYGGTYHANRGCVVSHDYLSILLVSTNVLFLIMAAPLNIYLVVKSVIECILSQSTANGEFIVSKEYLTLWQNSYHAISFIFYCFIGNKFRKSAKSMFRTIYNKLANISLINRCIRFRLISCCFDQKRSSTSGLIASTSTKSSDTRRPPTEKRTNSLIPLNTYRKSTYVTFGTSEQN